MQAATGAACISAPASHQERLQIGECDDSKSTYGDCIRALTGVERNADRSIEKTGFVERYSHAAAVDGLPSGEGVFLLCSFWLADNYVLVGRQAEARRLFERLVSIRNDVRLLSEEYDPASGRLLGNFPQAFSHVGLVNTAHNISHWLCPTRHRQQGGPRGDMHSVRASLLAAV